MPEVDLYALTHNETSTGVMMPLRRPEGSGEALVAVDATSGAGGLRFDPSEVDAYYFAPQKGFASDGGLWLAVLSPAAIERMARIHASGRWTPAFLDLQHRRGAEPPRPDLQHAGARHHHPGAAPAGVDAGRWRYRLRGGSVGTLGPDPVRLGGVDGLCQSVRGQTGRTQQCRGHHRLRRLRGRQPRVAEALRSNGVVDTEPYRKLGRNQLRVAMFPAIDPEDVEALTRCIDHVVGRL